MKYHPDVPGSKLTPNQLMGKATVNQTVEALEGLGQELYKRDRAGQSIWTMIPHLRAVMFRAARFLNGWTLWEERAEYAAKIWMEILGREPRNGETKREFWEEVDRQRMGGL